MALTRASAAHLGARTAIVDAATRLLRDGGAPAVTTRAVAEAAGVPAPTIFRLFGDKDGLMEAVAEHVMAEYVAEKSGDAATEHGDPVEVLRHAWHRHIGFGLANPDLYALITAPGRTPRSPAAAGGTEVLASRVARLAAVGLLRVSEHRAVGMIHAAGTGVVLALLNQPPDARDDGLADATLDAVLGAVLTPAAERPPAAPAALAVAFAAAVPTLPALTVGERALLAELLDRVTTTLQDRPSA